MPPNGREAGAGKAPHTGISKEQWLNPVKRPFGGHDWINWCIPLWKHVLAVMEKPCEDPLARRQFLSACNSLDREPHPKTMAEANQRWQEFLEMLKKIRARWGERVLKQRIAAGERAKG
jgi:hypothetical protein